MSSIVYEFINHGTQEELYAECCFDVKAIKETWEMTSLIAISVQKMLFGSIPADQIGGPILIFQIYGEQAEQGFNEFIRLTALLSINLGLINLLPIPILDGGHIVFFLIELIKGRPVSEKNRELAQQLGLFMLVSLMVFAFYNDIVRVINYIKPHRLFY